MFFSIGRRCRTYQIRMEEQLDTGPQAVESDLELSAHLHECGTCRKGWVAAKRSRELFAGATEWAVQPSEAVVTRTMASVRGAEASRSALWHPFEVFASQFSLVASVVLLALSVFLGEFSPALRQAEVAPTASVEVTSEWPEPPAQPAPITQDEVLLSLVGVDNDI
jgi:predicted anti-sigma-YlaC factor YlaD